ncbi:hypothetical protein [Flavobacterium tructae]|uniref:DUF4932 domain-containing protein n=1 Tax=Flavobacterium tructae TaxID=1114873 RepID=A0A1S1J3N4_9FLAO|nr:hypothetical protein [Flavobacterium tructae]OHT44089.1 hypothetical protein BHE19_14250 [Flavobacterium tructae]OXB20271.1 hypothetical protein B0A71_07745 [Flavobacterium tructae]
MKITLKIKLLVVMLCAVTNWSFAQKTVFNIKYSEQLAVFVFLQNLSENYPDNVFKTEFQKSKYNTEKFQKLAVEFDHLTLDYSYPFEEFPEGSKKPMQSFDFLRKNLIETENLKDFKIRSIGVLTNKTLNDLTRIISAFTPIYNELIYNPNKEKFEKQLVEITKYAKENDLERYFEMGLIFYNSSWDTSIPFEIAFYPLPNSKGFTANSFGNNFISAIQTDLDDYKDLFSVMLHETYHIIYNEQPLEVKKMIDNSFKENKSKYSNYAYHLLNEALATSLANGYVYAQLNGKVDDGDWYNKKYINLMAKEIYPMLNEYISQKKAIDKSFIDRYIEIYETKFPNWINEMDNLMAYRYVISENEKDFDVIKQKYRYRSRSEDETEISRSTLEKMQKSNLTKMIIVSKNNAENLKLIKNSFKELKNWKFNAAKEFDYKILLEDKSQLFIINQKESELKALLD